MKSRVVLGVNFILCIVCLFISMKLFWNTGVFVDEYNLSPDIVLGGSVWMLMNWIQIGLIAIISMLTLILFIVNIKKKKSL